MNKITIITIALTVILLPLKGQYKVGDDYFDASNQIKREEKQTITIGLFAGGGGIVGVEFETLITDRIGFQIGMGLPSLQAAMNFHFKDNIRSSFISLQYNNIGFLGDNLLVNTIGPAYVYRGSKWFMLSAGIGAAIEYGKAFPTGLEKSPLLISFSIGGYIPI
jgi:hypothetical protein